MKLLRNTILLYIMAATLVSTTLTQDVPFVKMEPIEIVLISEHDLLCMAQNIYFESRGEPEEGMMAVANVVINRTKKSLKSVCEVIREPFQFSWYEEGVVKKIHDLQAFEKSKQIAKRALVYQEDNTDGALYFHASYVKPYWSRVFTKTAVIGNHSFYKE